MTIAEQKFFVSKPASYKSKYVVVLAIVSALLALPGGVANFCGLPDNVLLLMASIPLLILALMAVVCTPISLCMIFHAVVLKQWREVGFLMVSLFFPIAAFIAISLTNEPGFQGVMSV